MPGAGLISLVADSYRRGAYVRHTLPITAWAMLRLMIEHSRAFKGRYSPENNPLGVEIMEAQYSPHVRTVDVIGSNQWGKTFHTCEVPTLYDLCESRETVFYMNGSDDNAANLWSTRWKRSLLADAVLSQQLLERMEGGNRNERHFADGGLLYSTGPESAAALAQRESRIVRCSELEKTRAKLGNEASSYSLARDRAGAYPSDHLITSDCTITVRDGLAWIRFVQGDRSRPFIPCVACGHYAVPVHQRHLEPIDPRNTNDKNELALTAETTHLFYIPEIAQASPDAAEEYAQLRCRRCEHVFTTRECRAAIRAGVWVPAGCHIVRRDNPEKTPLPRVSWLDGLNRWVSEALSDADVTAGEKDPPRPPEWRGPRLPDGVEIGWTPEAPATEADAAVFPAWRADPRRSAARSFWAWRLFSPKYTIGQVAREIVSGWNGLLTGDRLDDQKNTTQKTFVIPWVEPLIGDAEDLNEDAVLACVMDYPRGTAPAGTVALTSGIDIGEREIHYVLRAWTAGGESYLVDNAVQETDFREVRTQEGIAWDLNDPRFLARRRDVVFAALDKIFARHSQVPGEDGSTHPINMAYIDSSYMSEEIYAWCARHSFRRVRPVKGRGSSSGRRVTRLAYAGVWNDACEKKALAVRDAKGRPLRHQYFDPADPRRLMFLDADFWKREVHSGILGTARAGLVRSVAGSESNMAAKPWFFLHADLAAKSPVPGAPLRKLDRYVTQVIAERWEERIDPRTKRAERVWREYQQANHYQDAEAYCLAAAAGLGLLPRYQTPLEKLVNAVATTVKAVNSVLTSEQHPPAPSLPVVRHPARPIRRTYG